MYSAFFFFFFCFLLCFDVVQSFGKFSLIDKIHTAWKVPYLEFFWSVFWTRKTPNTDTFYAVTSIHIHQFNFTCHIRLLI